MLASLFISLSLVLGNDLDRFYDLCITRAAAEVPGLGSPDFIGCGMRVFMQKGLGGEQVARQAEAALDRPFLYELPL